MKLPDEIEKLREEYCGEKPVTYEDKIFDDAFRAAFNAGFAAFRDSEMMRELVESIKTTQTFFDYEDKKEAIHNLQEIFKVLDKYRKWIIPDEEQNDKK